MDGVDEPGGPEAIAGELRARLQGIVRDGGEQQRRLAAFLLDHPEEIAFRSVRSLAAQANVTSSAVVRLSKALGFEGFDACKAAFQHAIRRSMTYAKRAAALRDGSTLDRYEALEKATHENLSAAYRPEMASIVEECAAALLQARRVYVFAVRSCAAIGHLYSYLGRMAFEHVQASSQTQTNVFDDAVELEEDDIVLAITYEHYSTEVVRGCEIARERGARVIALTDSQASPIAVGAWRTLVFPTEGPHFTPSLVAAFALCEALLAAMVALAPDAGERLASLEQHRKELGGYI